MVCITLTPHQAAQLSHQQVTRQTNGIRLQIDVTAQIRANLLRNITNDVGDTKDKLVGTYEVVVAENGDGYADRAADKKEKAEGN